MWTWIWGPGREFQHYKFQMLSTKQVCEKHILLQRNRYFKHLKQPMASFSAVPDVQWVGLLRPGVSSSGSYMHILLFMTHLCGLALLLETAILFGNKCLCTCRKSVRKGLLWKHFFPPVRHWVTQLPSSGGAGTTVIFMQMMCFCLPHTTWPWSQPCGTCRTHLEGTSSLDCNWASSSLALFSAPPPFF